MSSIRALKDTFSERNIYLKQKTFLEVNEKGRVGPSPRYLNSEPYYIGGFEKGDIEELLDMMEMNFVDGGYLYGPYSDE